VTVLLRRRENLGKVRSALRDVADENVAFVQLDVAGEAQAKAAVEDAVKQFGRIDVAVNNAGYAVMGNFEELPIADIEQQSQRTSGCGAHHGARCCQSLRKQRSGHNFLTSALSLA